MKRAGEAQVIPSLTNACALRADLQRGWDHPLSSYIERLMGDEVAIAGASGDRRFHRRPCRGAASSSGRMRHRPQPHGHFAIFLILSHYDNGYARVVGSPAT